MSGASTSITSASRAATSRCPTAHLTTSAPFASGRLAASYLGRLARMQEPLESVRGAGTIAMPTVELVRALIATSVCDTALAAEPLQRTLEPRILEYMQNHLAECDLTAARIAAEHNVSVRQLYKILGRSGITPADWIRARRLEECRSDLRNPALHHLTIEAIARRWGLTDPTHFSRAFKTAYGVSPSQWRAQTAMESGPDSRG
jgi:AraC-like DNA-binding protein